jgi:hypothetical protein
LRETCQFSNSSSLEEPIGLKNLPVEAVLSLEVSPTLMSLAKFASFEGLLSFKNLPIEAVSRTGSV